MGKRSRATMLLPAKGVILIAREQRRLIREGEAVRLWQVERFRPSHCPKCGCRFQKQRSTTRRGRRGDWERLWSPVKLGGKPLDSMAVRCVDCGNITATFAEEIVFCRTLAEAKAKQRDGYINRRATTGSKMPGENIYIGRSEKPDFL